MIILTHTITSRLRYIADFIGKEIFGEPFELITDTAAFDRYEGSRVNYTNQRRNPKDFWIQPHSILFETGCVSQTLNCFETNGQKAFFETKGDFPFDIFASSFYLLSRYEEYLPHQKDMYGRYAHENSLAFREGFLQLPLVNLWFLHFRNVIKDRFPGVNIPVTYPRFLPTYDIDEAWSYKHKDWWRTVGAMGKAILAGRWSSIAERRKVLRGKKADPFDSYEWIDRLHDQYQLKPYYFFLVAERTGKYDRNILPREEKFQELLRHHSKRYKIGVHPSWQSGDDASLIIREKQKIEEISGRKIISSRQHYIRFTLPDTYRLLIQSGFKEDFSMGYGSINGFRASTASPFFWYDLNNEQITELLLYPFCFMEANSFYEQKVSSEMALEEMRHYYQLIKMVNGTFISIWHNSFLGTEPKFAGWREVYEQFIRETCSDQMPSVSG